MNQDVGDAIGLREQLLVGREDRLAVDHRADRASRSVATAHLRVEQRLAAVEVRGVAQFREFEAELGPLIPRRQVIRREGVAVGGVNGGVVQALPSIVDAVVDAVHAPPKALGLDQWNRNFMRLAAAPRLPDQARPARPSTTRDR